MPSLNRVIRSGLGTLDADVGATDTRITLRFQHTGLPGGWPDLPIGLRLDVDVAPNSVSRGIVGVASTPVTGTTSTVYHVRLQRALGNAYSKGTAVTPLPLLVSIEPLDDILLRAGTTSTINLARHFLLSGGQQTDITWSISPANTTQPVGYLSRSGTTVTVHAIAAGNVSIAIGATAPGNSTLRHTATLGVTASNTAPIQSTPFPILSLTDGRQGQAVDGRDYFTDADGDALIVTPTTDDASIAVVAVQAGSGNLIWIISPVSLGTTSLEWEADDGHGGTAKGTQTVIVGANVAPHIVTPLVPMSMLVGASMPVDISGTFADANNDVLQLYAWTDDTNVAVVRGGSAAQDAVLDAEWYLGFAGLAQSATTVVLDSALLSQSGSVDFLVGAMVARGGQRATITAASITWSFLRSQDGQTVTRLQLTIDAFPLAVAAFTQMFLRDVRVAVPSDGQFTVRARAVPTTTLLYVQASDGTLTVQDSVGLIVHRPPVWQSIPDQTVAVGQSVIVDLANYAIEPDADPVTFRVRSIPVGIGVHLDGTRLFMRGVVNRAGGTITVRVIDQYNVSVDTTIAVTVTAPASEGPRAPLISRERAHELIGKRGESVTYQVGRQTYYIIGALETGTQRIGTSASGIGFAIAGPTLLTISDITLRTLGSRNRALLSLDNLNKPATSIDDGTFGLRGETYLIAAVEQQIDSGHVLSHRFTLDAIRVASPAPTGNGGNGQTPIRNGQTPTGNGGNGQTPTGNGDDGQTPPSSVPDGPRTATPARFTSAHSRADYPSWRQTRGPAWVTLHHNTRIAVFNPPDDVVPGDYIFAFTTGPSVRGGLARTEVVYVTVTVAPAVTPTLAAVAATETATIAAGDTALSVRVSRSWYTYTNVVPTYALSGAPSWITLAGNLLRIAPDATVTPDDYTATVTASGTGVADVPVTLTVTVTAVRAVTPTLVAVATTKTATIEAGDTAQRVDVTAWYTATDVVPTYALSGAPAWITLLTTTVGNTLRIAPASDVAAADYTATVTASGTGVSDVVVTLTVTVTAVPVINWEVATRKLPNDNSGYLAIRRTDGADLKTEDLDSLGRRGGNSLVGSVRITLSGTTDTFTVYQPGTGQSTSFPTIYGIDLNRPRPTYVIPVGTPVRIFAADGSEILPS